jgi:4-oxalomesaconate tautomerase
MSQIPIRCMLMRGGTSKGAYFLASDLPADDEARRALMLDVMGSPDPRQVDGLGGAHPLTSKIAIVDRSKRPDADVEFLFAQVGIDKAMVDTTPNCGNILSGVGPFAIERGLIKASDPFTRVRVLTLNTGTLAELVIETPGGRVSYEGNARIDGVPGAASPIGINFLDCAGSVCGMLLPTGSAVDVIDGVPMTLIDNGMPVIVMQAAALGITGYEDRATLDGDTRLKARLEELRLEAGRLMGLGDVSSAVVPKISLVAPPRAGGHVSTRNFIPRECHAAIGVFAAVTVATACIMPDSPAHAVAVIPDGRVKRLSVEHPTGEFTVQLEVGGTEAVPVVERAGLLRTARALFDGTVFVKSSAWRGARPTLSNAAD